MKPYAIMIHGGARDLDLYQKKHYKEYEQGLKKAILRGYNILKKKGSAMDAVTEAVSDLEDNPLFNAGRGSALNAKGEVEMDASIMDGKRNKAGAASIVRSVKNPIILARNVLDYTNHVILSGNGALEFAKTREIILEPDSYFITEHQFNEYLITKNTASKKTKKKHGTVGAVARDVHKNLAAATSTGGISNSLPGRIGDSCLVGAGCYANNKICAISGTGTGEVLINNVIAHTIAMYINLLGYSVQEACDYVIHKIKRNPKGEIGVIALDSKGNIGVSYNSEIMKRAWIDTSGKLTIKVF